MKRLIAVLLACLLLLPAFALAGGLAGLQGEQKFSLPDPAVVLEVKGSLLEEDYAFSSDYLCDAYVYEYASADVQSYLTAVQKAGYETKAAKIDGQDGYYVTGGEHKAMLVPDFNGKLLLLVEKGMTFDGDMSAGKLPALPDNPAPKKEAAEEDEYVKLTYNGRTYECTSPMYSNGREALHNAYNIWLTPHGSKITSINFTIPSYAAAGDTFTVWKDQAIPGLKFYVAEDGSYGQYYVSELGSIHSFGFAASTDYYVLNVEEVELDGGVTVITGTIRARFLYDTISYEIDFKVRVP